MMNYKYEVMVIKQQNDRKTNERRTNDERNCSKYVRERTSRIQFLSFIVHEHVRSSSVHVSFIHERFLPFPFIPSILQRTNEKNRIWSFIVRPRSCLDERLFVRPSCGSYRLQITDTEVLGFSANPVDLATPRNS